MIRASYGSVGVRLTSPVTLADLVVPPRELVHPPLSGLFFRYFDSESVSQLNSNGEFVAGRYARLNIAPAPPPSLDDPQRYFWADLYLHINREPVHTPFLSMSNHLFWILRLALKKSDRGIKDGKVSSQHITPSATRCASWRQSETPLGYTLTLG